MGGGECVCGSAGVVDWKEGNIIIIVSIYITLHVFKTQHKRWLGRNWNALHDTQGRAFLLLLLHWSRVTSSSSQGSSSMACLACEWQTYCSRARGMQEEMGMAVVSRVFPGGQQGDLALSCLLLCPYEGVRALKCHLRLLEVTTYCPWLTISLAKCEQIGAVISSCDYSLPMGSRPAWKGSKLDGKRHFPIALTWWGEDNCKSSCYQ